MNFKSLPHLLDYFKEEETCIKYYEQIRWNGNPTCHVCGSENPYKTQRGYKCSNSKCRKHYTVKVGTIFENSKIKFRIWFAAIYLVTNHKTGINSVELASDLGVTQKTAWFILHRIRIMLKDKSPEILGENKVVEADEVYIGGKKSNKLRNRRKLRGNEKRYTSKHKGKEPVVGIIERKGKVVLKHLPEINREDLKQFINNNISKGATVYTDESAIYKYLRNDYIHDTVRHSLEIFKRGDVHTNTIENVWSNLRRGLYGTYRQVSPKHLEKYLDEFTARFNTRGISSEERFKNFLGQSNTPLSYKQLING